MEWREKEGIAGGKGEGGGYRSNEWWLLMKVKVVVADGGLGGAFW